jgi:hypothetical protein
VSARAVNYVRDLVERQPLDILPKGSCTCAITSSPMKMQSVTFTGIEASYNDPCIV